MIKSPKIPNCDLSLLPMVNFERSVDLSSVCEHEFVTEMVQDRSSDEIESAFMICKKCNFINKISK